MQNIEEHKINCEPTMIFAGALLHFKSLDNVDISLLMTDLQKELNIEVKGSWIDLSNGLGKYIEILENGTVKLKDNISLNDSIEEDNCTLQEKLLEVAGNKIDNYFNSLDIEKFKAEKAKSLEANKEKALEEAIILLISDIQDDYDELVKYGFKNVDYFKSIIRADQYFAKHPEELEKYHIILKGNQNVQHCCFYGEVELDKTFRDLEGKKHILVPCLHRYDYSDHMKLVSYLSDSINYRSWDTEEQSYTDIFDRIVENTLINHTLEKAGLKDKKFAPIQDYINPNRLPLPTKKSDLKILYLDSIVSEYAARIARKLGLNVDFKEDSNSSLGKYVKSNLGKYDIIIVTRIYSRNLLRMNHESTEQCKDTGRELTLFVAQDDFYWGVDSDLADGIALEYVFGGNYAPDSECHSKKIRILRQPIEVESKIKSRIKDTQSEYSQMKGIIEASVNLYNQALLQNGKPAIKDLDLKTAEALEQDYVTAYNKKEAELAQIKAFDSIKNEVVRYLNYRKQGLILQHPKGITFIEGENGIRVDIIYQDRTLCSIVFSRKNENENLRIFKIQTLSKKGSLTTYETIGLYPSNYDHLEGIPNRPNEQQKSALTAIEKKIETDLIPLNNEAYKASMTTFEERKIYSKRRKKYRRKKN